jgi:hypothetical protein
MFSVIRQEDILQEEAGRSSFVGMAPSALLRSKTQNKITPKHKPTQPTNQIITGGGEEERVEQPALIAETSPSPRFRTQSYYYTLKPTPGKRQMSGRSTKPHPTLSLVVRFGVIPEHAF